MQEDEVENMNLVSNILENFEDIDPEEQSMFINLNIRNRRQRILHKISFETEVYDIYDPVFSSDYSSSGSSSSTSSSGSSSSESSEVSNSGSKNKGGNLSDSAYQNR